MKTIELFQWDLNRSIEVPSGSKAHFASVGSLQALVVMEQGGKASVPNILLQEPKDINVWIVRDGATTDSGKIRITSRPVPSDYVYTETDVETVETLTQAIVAAIESEIAHAEAQIAAAKAQADEATQTANQAITQAQETHKIAEADIAENRQLRETLKAEEAKRATAETNRKAEEAKRVEAEAARKSAETTRAANETKRTETFNSNLVSWNSKVDAACKKATDTASKAAQDAKTATDAAIAQTKEATNAAVAKADKATASATTAANKAETVVAQLPLPLGNTLKGEVESAMVKVHDAFPAPLVTTKVMGQSNQITTKGINLLPNCEVKETKDFPWGLHPTTPLVFETPLPTGQYTVSVECDKTVNLYYKEPGNSNTGSSSYSTVTITAKDGKRMKATFTADKPIGALYFYYASEGRYAIAKAQLEAGAKATPYEPFTGGKPSPSPEFPQEIINLNKAELITTGKNLLEISNLPSQPDTGISASIDDNKSVIVNGTTMKDTVDLVLIDGKNKMILPAGVYTLSIDSIGFSDDCHFFIRDKLGIWAINCELKKKKSTFSFDAPIELYECSVRIPTAGTKLSNARIAVQLEVGGNATGYIAPAPKALMPIDLKGNELCSLPNGIKDEVVIDAEGNVSLIKRVIKVDVSQLQSRDIQRQNNGKWLTYIKVPEIVSNGNKNDAICNKFSHSGDLNSAAIFGNFFVNSNNLICFGIPESLYPITEEEGEVSTPQIKSWFNEIKAGTVVYGMATNPQTIPLGKVELPALPDSTSNIWNNGNIPANVYIQYLKDVNIAYKDLENQIKQITAALSVMDTPTVIPEMAWGTPAAI